MTIGHAYMIGAFLIGAFAAALAPTSPARAGGLVQLAGDNCFEVGQDVAARQGATLVGAEPARRNGAAGCRVVLLHQGRDGERPRREEIFVRP